MEEDWVLSVYLSGEGSKKRSTEEPHQPVAIAFAGPLVSGNQGMPRRVHGHASNVHQMFILVESRALVNHSPRWYLRPWDNGGGRSD